MFSASFEYKIIVLHLARLMLSRFLLSSLFKLLIPVGAHAGERVGKFKSENETRARVSLRGGERKDKNFKMRTEWGLWETFGEVRYRTSL